LRIFAEANPDLPRNTLTYLTICQLPDEKIERMMGVSAAIRRMSLLAPLGVLGYLAVPTSTTLGHLALLLASGISGT